MLAKLGLPSRPQISRWLAYSLVAGLVGSLPVAPAFIPKAQAAGCTVSSRTVDTQTIVSFNDVQNCEWTVPNGVTSVRVLVVGGGGGGGGGVSGVYFGAGGIADALAKAISPSLNYTKSESLLRNPQTR